MWPIGSERHVAITRIVSAALRQRSILPRGGIDDAARVDRREDQVRRAIGAERVGALGEQTDATLLDRRQVVQPEENLTNTTTPYNTRLTPSPHKD